LLSLLDGSVSAGIQWRARDALATYLGGISRALLPERHFLVGERITLADICFVAELALFSNERARRDVLERQGLSPVLDGVTTDAEYSRAFAHFDRLRMHPAFAPDVEPYLETIDRTASPAARSSAFSRASVGESAPRRVPETKADSRSTPNSAA
jgi:hypothetical protein